MDLEKLYKKYYLQFPLKIRILRFLRRNYSQKKLYQKDIQNEFGIGKSHVSEVTTELEDEGFVEYSGTRPCDPLYETKLKCNEDNSTTLLYKKNLKDCEREIIEVETPQNFIPTNFTVNGISVSSNLSMPPAPVNKTAFIQTSICKFLNEK